MTALQELHRIGDWIAGAKHSQKIYDAVAPFSDQQIEDAFADDSWQRNYLLNIKEFLRRDVVLRTLPWNTVLPFADLCNARCTFCTSWLAGRRVLGPDDLAQYADLLPLARLFGIQGHGEPLANPRIGDVLALLSRQLDPRARSYIITNGALLADHLDGLLAGGVRDFVVSLNAVSGEVYETVMGLEARLFDQAVAALRDLAARRQAGTVLQTSISMVLTVDNIHQAADFVRLGNELGCTRIYLRTLAPSEDPPGLNYSRLPPSLHPRFAEYAAATREAVAKSTSYVIAQPDLWAGDVVSPEQRDALTRQPPSLVSRRDAQADPAIRRHYRELEDFARDDLTRRRPSCQGDGYNPHGRTAPFPCKFVYHNFNSMTLDSKIIPCCYMPTVPGHLPLRMQDFPSIAALWNGEAMTGLRRALRDGPLMDDCRVCPMQGE